LGIEEGDGNDNSQINKLVTEYYHQAWQILKTELKIGEHHSYQHLSCTNPSGQRWNSQLVKKGT
jgi:hypothetical protein